MNIKRISKSTRTASLLLSSILLLTGCAEQTKEEVAVQEYCLNQFIKERITIDTAKRLPMTESLALTGKVDYNPDKVISFVSPVSGRVTKTYFSLGEEVKKGQLLAELESAELSSLMAQKRSYQAQLLVAERALESAQTMHEDQIASQKDLIEAQSNLASMKAELENIEAQLTLYNASSERGVFELKAPASGIIVHKNIASGMQIFAEGDPLFTLSDLNEVWIMANIYTGNIAYIEEGMKVDILALAYPNEKFIGQINALSRVFDMEERVLKAQISMGNPNNKLMPGMFVDVMVEKSLEKSAVAVPAHALIFEDNQHFLLIYKDDCQIEIRSVDPTVQNANLVFFENHLKDGEQVITKNQLLIYNQLKDSN